MVRNKKVWVFLGLLIVVGFFVGKYIVNEKNFQEREQAIAPDNRATGYTDLGFDFREEKKENNAERAFKIAIELDPANQTQAYLGLAELYRFYMPEKEKETPKLLLSGLEYNEKDIVLLRALAQYYERMDDKSGAIHWYGKIAEYYPNDEPAKQKLDRLR